MQSEGVALCSHGWDPYWCEDCNGDGVQLLRGLQSMMHDINPHVHAFIYAMDTARRLCTESGHELKDMQLLINADSRQHHSGTTNAPVSNEIALLVPSPEATAGGRTVRDVRLQLTGGGVQRIDETHALYDPLKYPLLFPNGDSGWSLNQPFTNSNRQGNITSMLHSQYRLAYRNPDKHFNMLHFAGKLFQEWVCDHYAMKEQLDLKYQREHQDDLRADTYEGLADAISNDDGHNAGKPVILSSSFLGGERDMHQQYQNGMALHREHGSASLFHTITMNPKSKAIVDELPEGFDPQDRHDLVVRLFYQQVQWFIDLIRREGYYGHAVADIHVIEFQKRGLPHIHLLIILKHEHKIAPAEIDEIVTAQVPPMSQPERRERVLKTMVHGPCGKHNPNAKCMVDGKCKDGYPKQFTPESHYRDGQYYATDS